MADAEMRAVNLRGRRPRWIGLLLPIPVVLPLVTPLFNFGSPRVAGFPAFYWVQMAFIILGSAVTIVVYRAVGAGEGE